MLVGTAKECATVGIAGKDFRDTVVAVMNELLAAVSAKEGIAFPEGAVERLEAYTGTVADFPCGLKEFEFRNQYFYQLGCKLHNELLAECKQKKLLSFELP
jgi:ketopantoate reductase